MEIPIPNPNLTLMFKIEQVGTTLPMNQIHKFKIVTTCTN